jgi:prepilin-type processing-associated H-X9-DG protein
MTGHFYQIVVHNASLSNRNHGRCGGLSYSPPPRHLGSFNVLFCGGHVVSMTTADPSNPLSYVQ